MNQHIAHITSVVEEYDEAISSYTKKMGSELIEDIKLDDKKRWMIIAPKGNGNCRLLLAKAKGKAQTTCIVNQTGGGVFLFQNTDNFWIDFKNMKKKGVQFNEDPREEPYGTVAVFQDLYDNLWDLIQPKKIAR
ncbi:MAG: VOC family protein [Bacteroidota bacterium]